MRRLPRDITGDELSRALGKLGYVVTRQTGSHLRLTTDRGGQHHVTVPRHNPMRVGTLGNIISDVGAHLGMSRDELLATLFD